ncbi:bifunctional tRNA (5-methylaminomethyl-2-thiouridine)(34)-methyltransferase MnmD/FAD-dependent 5-carboxymethylaminomethyl-2-thiouridine(34) oxidoreductase MnmC [Leptospira fletcheri]|uniref:tRNA 5-methylaminomethyl-2-thiouridine biosynthesis bifunctional protein MnmC n=1 Tax=Leptospira fletcheri TaxID=2484981 RepID=A0A4R9GAC9_9LEPT|nr:bifunctional tRNA (5-methylaminomethyl-2-thiouridine)(34)-methyltransferase MnmD/FAD-dependent 5-carboxymethylaminomethyl-2-thiouridine(34) oxidoreductase MnmC [Leptospira fletcheri]TGK08583.1 bifunctional tRNA (5-methylaminomethyl-2-thiouridine)(34)-methyltransferase MnmD/FAD-dependent 5-carboxymethylaminomethyl-2-thiouridine(34) oxidoreductase MnmC [Leptospira fletcheri]
MIEWKDNGTPVSTEFDDIYFSPQNGLEETKHVFLSGNRLYERWTEGPFSEKKSFCILEIGFGTGLNFLATWQLWKETKRKNPYSLLRFVSYELFPLTSEEIDTAISNFPELTSYLEIFLKQYSALVPGCNHFLFETEGVALDLWIGDARECLPESSGKFDAFFLDGFAPSKNPELWGPEISKHFSTMALQDSTFATFTVARTVKDSMESAGFEIRKIPGYGKKREMLAGTFSKEPKEPEGFPFHRNYPGGKPPEKVIIVGAGLAGAGIARAFALRGIQVSVWDDAPPSRASSIPKAISHPHLTKFPSPASLWTLRGFSHSLRRYPDLLPEKAYEIVGTLQFPGMEMSWDRMIEGIRSHNLSKEIVEPEENTNAKTPDLRKETRGVFYPKGFWTETPEFVSSLLEHPNVFRVNAKVSRLERSGNSWRVFREDGETEDVDCVILANSSGIQPLLENLLGESLFLLSKVRGQLLELSSGMPDGSDPILIGEHYLTPSKKGVRVLGSTFDEFDADPEPREKDRDKLLDYAEKLFTEGGWKAGKYEIKRQFVGFRSQTKDRFPVLGEILEPKEFRRSYTGSALPKNKNKTVLPVEPLRGLFVFGGLGSRGVLSSLIGGETLASIVLGEPLPIENSLYSALHPSRFLYREIRKKDVGKEKA